MEIAGTVDGPADARTDDRVIPARVARAHGLLPVVASAFVILACSRW